MRTTNVVCTMPSPNRKVKVRITSQGCIGLRALVQRVVRLDLVRLDRPYSKLNSISSSVHRSAVRAPFERGRGRNSKNLDLCY